VYSRVRIFVLAFVSLRSCFQHSIKITAKKLDILINIYYLNSAVGVWGIFNTNLILLNTIAHFAKRVNNVYA